MGIVKKLGGTIDVDVVGEQAQLGMETQSATRSVLVPALLVGDLASCPMKQSGFARYGGLLVARDKKGTRLQKGSAALLGELVSQSV